MRLVRLRIRHFRRFDEAVFSFDPRLNVLVGPNEAGKSTLRHAILTAFFVHPATTSKKVAEWRPWGSETLGAIAVEFEAEGRRYELRKDFERRRADLRDLTHGLTWEGTQAQERVIQALGLPTEGLYRATAMIEQTDIAVLRAGSVDIGDRLSRVVQAGPGDAEAGAVIKRLDKDIVELERGLDKLAKNPGTIKRVQNEVETLQAQHADLQRRIARLDAQRDELRRITVEHEVAARELRDREALLGENQIFLTLEAELQPLRTQERQLAERSATIERGYERLAAIRHDLEALQAQGVPDDTAMARLHAAQGAVQTRQDEARRQQQAIRAAETRLQSLTAEPMAGPWGRAVVPAGIFLVVALIASVLGALRQLTALLAAGALLFVAGIALVVAEARRQRHRAELRSERENSAARLEEMRAGLNLAEEALLDEAEALQAVVAITGSATVDEALARHAQLRVLSEERTVVQGQLEALLGRASLEAVREELAQTRADIARREAALARPEALTKRLPQLQVQQLEHDVKDLSQRVHRLQARQDHLERETAEGAPDYEALVVLQERLAERQEVLEAARRKARVYQAVREGLHTARQQTLIPARRLVEERAGEYLGLLTGGAYDRVHVEEPP
ncbi:MAG: AAA family ATPase, partial [Armatimonadetes bacterium]|nr:AAA family ATPase [Armatimonadota bacterium]